MKKYFAIACVVCFASSVLFSAQAQGFVDPLDAAEKAAFEKYRTAINTIVNGRVDVEYNAIVYANAKKALDDKSRLSEEELNKIRVSLEAAKKASKIVIHDNFGEMCVAIENGVARCSVGPQAKEMMANIAAMQAQAAVVKGEKGVDEISKITQAYLAKWIAANKAKDFQNTLGAAVAEVQGGQRMLGGAIRNAELQIMYTAWLINSPLNFFGIGQAQLAAGQSVLPLGRDILDRLARVRQNIKDIQSILAEVQAGLAGGTMTPERLESLQKSAEAIANRLAKNGSEILAILNDQRIAAAVAGDRDKAKQLADMIIKGEQSLGMAASAIQQFHSEEARAQMKALAESFRVPTDISRPLHEQLPQLKPQHKPPAGSSGNPVKFDPPQTPPVNPPCVPDSPDPAKVTQYTCGDTVILVSGLSVRAQNDIRNGAGVGLNPENGKVIISPK